MKNTVLKPNRNLILTWLLLKCPFIIDMDWDGLYDVLTILLLLLDAASPNEVCWSSWQFSLLILHSWTALWTTPCTIPEDYGATRSFFFRRFCSPGSFPLIYLFILMILMREGDTPEGASPKGLGWPLHREKKKKQKRGYYGLGRSWRHLLYGCGS